MTWARSLTEGRRALENPLDLALVDLSLPDGDGDGLDLVGDVRARLLHAGADDYRLEA